MRFMKKALAFAMAVMLVVPSVTAMATEEGIPAEPQLEVQTEPEAEAGDILEDVSEDVPQSVIEDTSGGISQSVTEDISEDVSQSVTEDTSENVSESVTEDVSEDVSESVTEDVSEDVSESITEDISEDVSESVTEDIPENVSGTVTENVTESEISEADEVQFKQEEAEEEQSESEADEVQFKIGEFTGTVVKSDAELDEEDSRVCFEDDNSYTINLSGSELTFPVEAVFTYGGEKISKIFTSEEDTAEVGKYTFRVTFDSEISETFQQPSLMSLQPLEVKDLSEVDLTDLTPLELTQVSMDKIFTNGELEGASGIAWKRESADGSDYNVISVNDTINLSWGTGSYTRNFEMIVGSGNQLNPGGVRYNVPIKTRISGNWLEATAKTDAAAEIPVSSTSYNSGSLYDADNRSLRISVPSALVRNKDSVLVSLNINKNVFSSVKFSSVKAYKGKYGTTSEAQSGSEITGQICSADFMGSGTGYPVELQGENWITFVAFDGAGRAVGCMPLQINIRTVDDLFSADLYQSNLTQSVSYRYIEPVSHYSNEKRNEWRALSSSHEYYEYEMQLNTGNPANGAYYYRGRYSRSGVTDGNALVTAVYKGAYGTISEATAAKAEDIKASFFGDGYTADYSQGVEYTVFIGQDGADQVVCHGYLKTTEYVAPDSFRADLYQSDLTQRVSYRYRESVSHYSNEKRNEWRALPSSHKYYEYEMQLSTGSPADGKYYYRGIFFRSGVTDGNTLVTAAYKGAYGTISEAAAAKAEDIKASFFGDGYAADYSQGVEYTVFIGQDGADQVVYHGYLKTTEYVAPPKKGTSLTIKGLVGSDGKDIEPIYRVDSQSDETTDSYGEKNFITILVDENTDLTKLALKFTTDAGAKLFVDGGGEQKSGESFQNYSGGAVHFTVIAEDESINGKSYWVQIKQVKTGEGELYINSLADEASNTHMEGDVIHSTREVMLDSYHSNLHDIWVANVGAEDIPALSVQLSSDVVELDPYWTLNGKSSFPGFSTVESYTGGKPQDDGTVIKGELPNLAKLRLRAKEGVERGTTVSGTLTFKSNDKTLMVLTLTGLVGDPMITTPSDLEAVKYVPYETVIQNNNKYSWIKVNYSLEAGAHLPKGVAFNPGNGRLYGVPKEMGSFEFTIRASFLDTGENYSFSDSTKDFILEVKDNTNENVFLQSDTGYSLITPIGVETTAGSYDFYLEQIADSLFVSEGVFDDFIDLWLNGEKLTAGVDYAAVSGSTRITVSAQTMQNKVNSTGNNTIAAEFRANKDLNNDLKRTAQNFHLDNTDPGNNGSGGNNGSSGNGGSGGNNGSSGNGGSGGNNSSPGNNNSGGNNGSSGNNGSGGNGSSSGNSSGDGSGNGGGATATGVTIRGCLVDVNNNVVSGTTVELHSTPRTTVTNANGRFEFANVEYGSHQLFVKDTAGNILASTGFDLVEGSTTGLAGSVLTAPAGSVISMTVKVADGALTLSDVLYVGSAATGDSQDPVGWMLLILLSIVVLSGVVFFYKKRLKFS